MSGHTNTSAEFGSLFHELLTTRAQYESLRIGGAPFTQRADLLERLHTLRHDMNLMRRTLG